MTQGLETLKTNDLGQRGPMKSVLYPNQINSVSSISINQHF